jgi:hypothetical protein
MYSASPSLTSALDWGGWSTPRPGRFTPVKILYATVYEAGWTLGPVWKGAENLAPTGTRSPDHPARSVQQYRLRYLGPHFHRNTREMIQPSAFESWFCLVIFIVINFSFFHKCVIFPNADIDCDPKNDICPDVGCRCSNPNVFCGTATRKRRPFNVRLQLERHFNFYA